MTILSKSVTLAVAAGLAGGQAAPAMAQITVLGELPRDMLSERVAYADLSLASAAGEQRLRTRVAAAVSRVCQPWKLKDSYLDHQDCRAFARSGAEPQVALAIERASQIAQFGTSRIAPVAILVTAPSR